MFDTDHCTDCWRCFYFYRGLGTSFQHFHCVRTQQILSVPLQTGTDADCCSAVVRPCQLLERSPTTPTTKISCSPPGFWMTSRSPSPLGSECGRWLGMTMTEASSRCGVIIYYLSTIYHLSFILLLSYIYLLSFYLLSYFRQIFSYCCYCLSSLYSPKLSIYIKH